MIHLTHPLPVNRADFNDSSLYDDLFYIYGPPCEVHKHPHPVCASLEQALNWASPHRPHIQKIFPHTPPGVRERLMSGLCDAGFTLLFGPDPAAPSDPEEN